MWTETYTLAYCGPVMKQRHHDYRAHIMDHWEIVSFYQDMIEGNCLPMNLVDCAAHFIERRLCTYPPMAMVH
jgi:hypothetical protein